MEAIANRMKENYEKRCQHKLTRRVPVIIRVDGCSFSSSTRNMHKPYDSDFINSMQVAALRTAETMQGFKAAYIQSDEVTFLLTDYDYLSTEAWFDYKLEKLVSVSASTMAAHFNHVIPDRFRGLASFDSRAFNMPKEDVPNCFLWRMLDWRRNSVHMYAQHFFSHKELHGKSQSDMHDMLYSIGKNWAEDLYPIYKNGSWLLRNKQDSTGSGYIWDNEVMPTWQECYDRLKERLEPKDEEQHKKRSGNIHKENNNE